MNDFPNIKLVDQSSSLTYGPTHEIFKAITDHGYCLTDLKQKIDDLESIGEQTKVLCNAYQSLHCKRIIVLLSFIPIFVLAVVITAAMNGLSVNQIANSLKFIVLSSSIGLLIEAIWFPSKIKIIDREIERTGNKISSVESNLATMKTNYDKLCQKVDSIYKSVSANNSNASRRNNGRSANKRS
jgi:uncharacterized protein YoxC